MKEFKVSQAFVLRDLQHAELAPHECFEMIAHQMLLSILIPNGEDINHEGKFFLTLSYVSKDEGN